MIRYRLRCDHEHEFDAWFRSAADHETQTVAGQVVCPSCGSTAVVKALMAPAVATSEAKETVRLAAHGPEQAIAEFMREMVKSVRASSDYVGSRFAEEARRIHNGEAVERGIYGEATPEDAKALLEEGIGFHPLPTLPEERN